MYFVKKRIINVPNLLFIHLFFFRPEFWQRESATLHPSLEEDEEMEKFFLILVV